MKRLDRKTRETLIKAYIEHIIALRGELPTVREVKEAVGGNIHTITQVLRSYRTFRRDAERRFLSEYDRRLMERGLVRRFPSGMTAREYRSYKPVEVRGKPVSESLIEERR